MYRLPKKYRRIFRKLSKFELQRSAVDDNSLSSEDVLGDLKTKQRQHLFLNFYSEAGIYRALEAYGILRSLRIRGFRDFIIKINTDDPFQHLLKFYFEKEEKDHLLGEIYARRQQFIPPSSVIDAITPGNLSMIAIEWLTLQNPRANFTRRRPPLPGQDYPGLKIARKILMLLIEMALRLKTDGLLNTPENFHNAAFYSPFFHFFNPKAEATFQALQRDLAAFRFEQAAWAVALNCIFKTTSDTPWKWFSEVQIFPVSDALTRYFNSESYKNQVNEIAKGITFGIDRKKFNDRIRKQPASHLIGEL